MVESRVKCVSREIVEVIGKGVTNKFNPLNWLESGMEDSEDEEVESCGRAESGPQSFPSPAHKRVNSDGEKHCGPKLRTLFDNCKFRPKPLEKFSKGCISGGGSDKGKTRSGGPSLNKTMYEERQNRQSQDERTIAVLMHYVRRMLKKMDGYNPNAGEKEACEVFGEGNG
ncbi:hypothetical protein L484_004960 [Morus notabilis]|uniref:Uncharacterized protein n=1 Tax=Morus notabilis TaxID=981085 RepID=W9QS85_9ROSA|nr:hypothetical protein L484_004960 [Morus notabilis]